MCEPNSATRASWDKSVTYYASWGAPKQLPGTGAFSPSKYCNIAQMSKSALYINHFYVVKVPLGIKYLQVCITDFLFIKYTSHSFSSAMFDCTGFLFSYIQVIHFLVHSILVSNMQVTNFLVHCLTKTNSPILLSVLFSCCLKKKKIANKSN